MSRNIFAIQQNLTNITMSREADLDHARQYYEIMYQTVKDKNFSNRVARATFVWWTLSLCSESPNDGNPV